MGIKRKRNKDKSLRRTIFLRSKLMFFVFCAVATVIVVRIIWVQSLKGEHWRKQGKELNIQEQIVRPLRGNIYADDRSLLATSLPVFYIAMDPTITNKRITAVKLDSLCYHFSEYFQQHSKEWYKDKIISLRKRGKKYFKVSNKPVRCVDLKMIKKWPVVRLGRIKGGVFFDEEEQRVKPFKQLAARTIGYKQKDNNGAGIEYSFDKELKGTEGKVLSKRIPNGNWRPINDDDHVPAVDGKDIYTTLNINLQDIATSALKRELIKNKADFGCVALMEVATGDIKAMGNLMEVKGSNGTKFVEGYNYLVGQVSEPGSTIKLAAALALLEFSNIRLKDKINTRNGQYMFADKKMTDYSSGGFGVISFQDVFEKSSNIGISKEVVKVFGHQPQKYIDYLKQLNLDKVIDIGLQGAGKPYINRPGDKLWSGTTLPWMSIGYGLKLTPLHTLMLYNAIANNGIMVQPRLIKQISDANKVTKNYKVNKSKDKICSEETLKSIKLLLRGVVERGTAKNIKDPYIKISGKTGTAKIYNVQKKSYENKYYTSFAGYFPSDKPKYSCIVVIANPKGYKQHGSDVAAPVFKFIANKINAQDLQLRDMKVVEDVKISPNQSMPLIKGGYKSEIEDILHEINIPFKETASSNWVKTKREGNHVVFNNLALEAKTVPNVQGFTLRDALFLLEKSGLDVRFSGNGRVAVQSLSPGMHVAKGKQIKLILN